MKLTSLTSKRCIQQVVGSNIRVVRESQQISQEELGFRSDLHRAYIGHVECGNRNISLKSLEKIAQALGVEWHFLLKMSV
ncbi:MAG: hypothetical protein RIS64_501 [Bacteroidota bacterium]|jgi:transcriptional regulator with XRE-family HTH domain